jgi:predicted cupin superfamily sugar epimerase
METARVIELLNLQHHPEGGWYAETFRSPIRVNLPDGRERSAVTAIHFLLEAGGFSAWHRVSSDEIWHFQEGNPLELVTIDPHGMAVTTRLGPDLARGMKTHHTVPARWWQAARPVGPDGHTLVVCTVSPGFDFADFEMPGREELLGLLPGQRDLIQEFTRSTNPG